MFGFSGVAGVFLTAGGMMLLAALFIAVKVRVELPQHGQPDSPATHF